MSTKHKAIILPVKNGGYQVAERRGTTYVPMAQYGTNGSIDHAAKVIAMVFGQRAAKQAVELAIEVFDK